MSNVNSQIAERFNEVAGILEAQGANTFRVGAYRHAAALLRGLERPVDEIVRTGGIGGLQKLPGIGETLARFIYQLVVTGRLPMLERLRGESDPVKLLRTVPGIGEATAQRLYENLGIETLEELELAAHDGRLASLGFGEKRLTGIRDSLATRLGRVRPQTTLFDICQPKVSEILDVDDEYRNKTAQGLLPRIAPRRFNPKHEAWLPILHTSRRKQNYTALFSNTPRAHQLNKTSDWVVIYYDGAGGERQCTVITAAHGPLIGKRIVRGREAECLEYYYPRLGHPPQLFGQQAA
jgi:hypothetical protein